MFRVPQQSSAKSPLWRRDPKPKSLGLVWTLKVEERLGR